MASRKRPVSPPSYPQPDSRSRQALRRGGSAEDARHAVATQFTAPEDLARQALLKQMLLQQGQPRPIVQPQPAPPWPVHAETTLVPADGNPRARQLMLAEEAISRSRGHVTPETAPPPVEQPRMPHEAGPRNRIEEILGIVSSQGPDALSPEDLDLYLQLVELAR